MDGFLLREIPLDPGGVAVIRPGVRVVRGGGIVVEKGVGGDEGLNPFLAEQKVGPVHAGHIGEGFGSRNGLSGVGELQNIIPGEIIHGFHALRLDGEADAGGVNPVFQGDPDPVRHDPPVPLRGRLALPVGHQVILPVALAQIFGCLLQFPHMILG